MLRVTKTVLWNFLPVFYLQLVKSPHVAFNHSPRGETLNSGGGAGPLVFLTPPPRGGRSPREPGSLTPRCGHRLSQGRPWLEAGVSASSIVVLTVLPPLAPSVKTRGREPSIRDQSPSRRGRRRLPLNTIDPQKDELLVHAVFPTHRRHGYISRLLELRFVSLSGCRASPPPDCFLVLTRFRRQTVCLRDILS